MWNLESLEPFLRSGKTLEEQQRRDPPPGLTGSEGSSKVTVWQNKSLKHGEESVWWWDFWLFSLIRGQSELLTADQATLTFHDDSDEWDECLAFVLCNYWINSSYSCRLRCDIESLYSCILSLQTISRCRRVSDTHLRSFSALFTHSHCFSSSLLCKFSVELDGFLCDIVSESCSAVICARGLMWFGVRGDRHQTADCGMKGEVHGGVITPPQRHLSANVLLSLSSKAMKRLFFCCWLVYLKQWLTDSQQITEVGTTEQLVMEQHYNNYETTSRRIWAAKKKKCQKEEIM